MRKIPLVDFASARVSLCPKAGGEHDDQNLPELNTPISYPPLRIHRYSAGKFVVWDLIGGQLVRDFSAETG